MKPPNIRHYPGYTGAFSKDRAEGAYPNGTRVMKSASEADDGNPDGTLGTVLGSIDVSLIDPEMTKKLNARFMYWVEWDPTPKVAVAVVDRKIARAS